MPALKPLMTSAARGTLTRMALTPPPRFAAAGTWAAWATYCGVVLFSEGGIAPGNSALHTEPGTIQEALNLSLNFWFVLPTIAPTLAPALDPTLEAFFNVLICYALLFFGFVADERENDYPGGMVPYLTGSLFLTNVFYLPMLALRTPRAGTDLDAAQSPPLSPLERLAESRLVAAVVGVVVPLLALGWFGYGRADVIPPGFESRLADLTAAITSDRLTFSFAADYLTFALFQSVLVPADAARRGVDAGAPSVRAAQLVPLLGLVGWMLTRPSLIVDESE